MAVCWPRRCRMFAGWCFWSSALGYVGATDTCHGQSHLQKRPRKLWSLIGATAPRSRRKQWAYCTDRVDCSFNRDMPV